MVDQDDKIYYVFRFLLTPTVRKYNPAGELVAEWHPATTHLDRIVEHAKETYERKKQQTETGAGGNPVFTAAAFDNASKTLWIAAGNEVIQLDNSGMTIQHLDLFLSQGSPPLQANGLVVSQGSLLASSWDFRISQTALKTHRHTYAVKVPLPKESCLTPADERR